MLLGLSLALVSGICMGVFLAPMRLLKGWEWENIWAVWSIVGLLVGPVVVALWSIPSTFKVFEAIGLPILLTTLVIGAIAGMSGFLYSVSVPAIGLGLATALNSGSNIAVSLFPLVMVHGDTVSQWSGLLTIFGIAVSILGITLCTKAGSIRDQESKAVGAPIVHGRGLSFVKGVFFCVLAGVISSGMNLGLAFPIRMSEVAREFGSSEFGAANAFLAPYLVGGFFSNFTCALYHLYRNRTIELFWMAGAPRGSFWSVIMALLFVLGVCGYAESIATLGSFGAIIAWGIFTGAAILSSGLWDVLQKEWFGRAAKIMASGIATLVLAIVILGLAQYFYQLGNVG